MFYHEIRIDSTHIWENTGTGHCWTVLRYPGLFYQTPTYAINRWQQGSSQTKENIIIEKMLKEMLL